MKIIRLKFVSKPETPLLFLFLCLSWLVIFTVFTFIGVQVWQIFDHFFQTIFNIVFDFITKFSDFLVTDFVVSFIQIFTVCGFSDFTAFDVFLDQSGNIHFGQVHTFVSDVVSLSGHGGVVLKSKNESSGAIFDMQESSSEVTFVNIELFEFQCKLKEIVDEEISSWSWRRSKN